MGKYYYRNISVFGAVFGKICEYCSGRRSSVASYPSGSGGTWCGQLLNMLYPVSCLILLTRWKQWHSDSYALKSTGWEVPRNDRRGKCRHGENVDALSANDTSDSTPSKRIHLSSSRAYGRSDFFRWRTYLLDLLQNLSLSFRLHVCNGIPPPRNYTVAPEYRLSKNRIIDSLFHMGTSIHNLRRGFFNFVINCKLSCLINQK